MSQDSKKAVNEIYTQIALITALFGKPALDAVDRVEAFIKKYNPAAEPPAKTENLYGIGVIGYHIFLIPKGAKDPATEAVLAIDMSTNFVFVDAMGMFGPARTAADLYAEAMAERKAKAQAAMNPEMDEAEQDRLLDKLDSKTSKLH